MLAAAKLLGVLEPHGLCTANDSRPDGLTLTPWSRGCSLVWDVTVHDSFAPSNICIGLSNHGAGCLADQAARQKPDRLGTMSSCMTSHLFVPLAIETTGVFGEQSMAFVRDLSRQIQDTSGEVDEFSRLCQRICICIQYCNSPAIWELFLLATLTVMMNSARIRNSRILYAYVIISNIYINSISQSNTYTHIIKRKNEQ